MSNFVISFGQIIPKMQFQIQRKDTKEFVPAIFSEVDCNDEEDYTEVKNLGRKWTFNNYIAQGIAHKNSAQRYFNQMSNKSIYEVQDKDGQLIGIAQTETKNGICNIEYIESKPDSEYKYIGQAMIAAIGKESLDRNCYQLTVATPVDEAMPFYINACGFNLFGEFFLKMNSEQIKSLIRKTEQKTNSPIINLQG